MTSPFSKVSMQLTCLSQLRCEEGCSWDYRYHCANTQQKDNYMSHSTICLLFSICLFFAMLMLICFAWKNDDKVFRTQRKLERKRTVTSQRCYMGSCHTIWSKLNASISDTEIFWSECELCLKKIHWFSGCSPKIEFLTDCILLYAWAPYFQCFKMCKPPFVTFKLQIDVLT